MDYQNTIQRFSNFVSSLFSVRYDEVRALPGANVESAEAFDEMRRHLLKLYNGIDAQHSFMDSGGQVFDCIPIEQQPALRGERILSPPPLPLAPLELYKSSPHVSDRNPEAAPPQLDDSYTDRFGNQMSCPSGTIPMMRLTLEQMARFRTLQDCFRKGPKSLLVGPEIGQTGVLADDGHRYAIGRQNVRTLGGVSNVNVWKPRALGIHNSLSQQWYGAGDGIFSQSVECGWQVCPSRYGGDDQPRLFVYWTPDDHRTGGFNQEVPGFVKTNPNVLLGGPLVVSQPGGPQYDYEMGFTLSNGAWWFRFNGDWAGYYPISLFGGGPLASNAERNSFGGEVAGIGTLPGMGSGAFPGSFGTAAYQRNLTVYPTGAAPQIANLAPIETAPRCFKIVVANNSPSTWGTFIFFGGPGGTLGECPRVI